MKKYTAEYIARCKDAMGKPAPREALAFIASGRCIVHLRDDGDVELDQIDSRPVRDPDTGRRMILAGAWPLHAAGMIDDFGLITGAGRIVLSLPPAAVREPEDRG